MKDYSDEFIKKCYEQRTKVVNKEIARKKRVHLLFMEVFFEYCEKIRLNKK